MQKIDQMLIEPDGDVVVILDQARVSQTNLINEPGEVGDSTEEHSGAAGIW